MDVKEYIIDHSSAKDFKTWEEFYAYCNGGARIIEVYTKDVVQHKKRVAEYLEKYTEEEIRDIKRKLEEDVRVNIANQVLKELGYKFEE